MNKSAVRKIPDDRREIFKMLDVIDMIERLDGYNPCFIEPPFSQYNIESLKRCGRRQQNQLPRLSFSTISMSLMPGLISAPELNLYR